MTDDLKPCPLCGAKPEMAHGMGEVWVLCQSCFCGCGTQTYEHQLNWNHRPIEDALVKALEAMIDLVNADRQDAVECDKMARAALALAKGGNDAQ